MELIAPVVLATAVALALLVFAAVLGLLPGSGRVTGGP